MKVKDISNQRSFQDMYNLMIYTYKEIMIIWAIYTIILALLNFLIFKWQCRYF